MNKSITCFVGICEINATFSDFYYSKNFFSHVFGFNDSFTIFDGLHVAFGWRTEIIHINKTRNQLIIYVIFTSAPMGSRNLKFFSVRAGETDVKVGQSELVDCPLCLIFIDLLLRNLSTSILQRCRNIDVFIMCSFLACARAFQWNDSIV